MCDIRLWRQGIVLPHSSSLTNNLTAESATICIAHTKNGSKGIVVHHEAFGGPICLVAVLAQQIAIIQGGHNTSTFNLVY
jgi:hypothetical protein